MTEARQTRVPWLGRLACLGVSVLVLAWILHRVDVTQLGEAFARANLIWIGLAGIACGTALFLSAARWHLVLRLSQMQVHAEATWRTVLIGHLFNTILLGPTGGDLAKAAYYARRYRFPTSGILATCLLDRALGGIGFFLFAVATPGFSLYAGGWSERAAIWGEWRHTLAWGMGIAVVAIVTLSLLRRRLKWASPLQRIANAFLAHGKTFVTHPKVVLRGIAYAVVAHLCISGVFLLCLKGVTETPFSLASIFWIFPIISLITSAPVTFSGAGLREGAALFFFSMYGIPGEDAVAASLLVLSIYVGWAGLAGLVLWRERSASRTGRMFTDTKTISVVIPVLNEAESLSQTVAKVKDVPEVTELVVVDGGSTDQTIEVAERLGCRVITSERGRGHQLRAGASQARGDIIVMLHADTWLPSDAGVAMMNCLRDPWVAAGGFWKTFRERNWLLTGSRFRCGLRMLLFRRILGDQVLFVRRKDLERIGGVPAVPLMEEFELCRRLRGVGRLALAGTTVTTSARRFVKRGIVRTYLRMGHVTVRYYLGSAPQELQEIYERD